MTIFWRSPQRNGDVIFAIRRNGNNPPSAERTAERFTIIAFVQPEALGFPFARADTNAIEGGQDRALIMPVSFGDGEVQRMPMRLDEEVALEAANVVFAGVADLSRSPFFDLITRAS